MFIYNWIFKPTLVALYIMACWSGKVTIESYKKTCAFIKVVIPQNIGTINIHGNINCSNNSAVNINGNTQIINNVYGKGNLNIIQDGTNGNNYQEVNNVNTNGDINIRQGNTGGRNISIIRNCPNIDGNLTINQGDSTNSTSFSNVNFNVPIFDFPSFTSPFTKNEQSTQQCYPFTQNMVLKIGSRLA